MDGGRDGWIEGRRGGEMEGWRDVVGGGACNGGRLLSQKRPVVYFQEVERRSPTEHEHSTITESHDRVT